MLELVIGVESPKLGGGSDADPVRPILLENSGCFFSVFPLGKNWFFKVFNAQQLVLMSGFYAISEVVLRGMPYGGPWSERASKKEYWENECFRRLRSLNATQ